MQLFSEFPPGLWVVKRIDNFHFSHNDSESALVDVDLQKLPFDNVAPIRGLQQGTLAELLGRPPANAAIPTEPPQPFIRLQMLAGYLGLLQAGDVIEAGRPISRLPTQHAMIGISAAHPPKDIRFDDLGHQLERPQTWTAKYPYHALNKFEYLMATELDYAQQTNSSLRISKTRCLVIQHAEVEYILPKMVIFQAYYCLNSSFINALCNKPWKDGAPEVISFDNYDSGIGTRIDAETGAWDIVLRTGMDFNFGRQLALYWFDPFARACTTALYTEALADNQTRRGAHGRGWLASANIPHALSENPLKLSVEGYLLRKLRPGSKEKDRRRFLITSILGSSWPLQGQVIRVALHNSSAKGEVQVPDSADRPYQNGQAPVEGDPGAVATSNADPHVASVVNEFQGAPFAYLDAPPLEEQQKQSSKIYGAGVPPDSEGASAEVSAGTPGYSADAPPKADIAKPLRDPSQQFDFLMRMMERLVDLAVVDSYHCCGPNEPTFLVERNGLPCWTLISAAHRKAGRLPRKGWELVKVPVPKSPGNAGKPTFTRHARCVLILSIRIAGAEIILFEVEPRPSETSAYRLVAFERDRPIESDRVGPTLDAIRASRGTFDEKQVSQIFGWLTTRPPLTRKHAYRTMRDLSTNKEVVCDLNEHALGHWLLSVAASAGVDPAIRSARLNARM